MPTILSGSGDEDEEGSQLSSPLGSYMTQDDMK